MNVVTFGSFQQFFGKPWLSQKSDHTFVRQEETHVGRQGATCRKAMEATPRAGPAHFLTAATETRLTAEEIHPKSSQQTRRGGIFTAPSFPSWQSNGRRAFIFVEMVYPMESVPFSFSVFVTKHRMRRLSHEILAYAGKEFVVFTHLLSVNT